MQQGAAGVRAAGIVRLVLATAAFGVISAASGPAAAQSEAPAPSEGAEPPQAAPETCSKSEFESAVDHAAERLRDLNNKNRPEFQTKLRQLKEKRGWDDNQFLKEAAPFVKDDKIAVFDAKSNELLASISSLGQEGANAPEPNCTMLGELRGHMQTLIDTQDEKWRYMFEKLDGEIAK
ncbi:hypothetical protein [Hyphomicrobium sp. CS1GBMeth3]|uniref:hypothetical protein n=1 Tax=Hyphomicrobium sp. CS1GBMeth3 TaxID=1892845 RepID=UPI00093168F2|nr:hypothetical protein [Hyphomicrobium sp. CS1GBMeth3]